MRSALSDADILAQIPAARAREAYAHKHGLRATSARYDRTAERVVLELTNGCLFGFPVRAIPALRTATAPQRAAVEVDASGGAVRWAALDIDLSVPGLLLSAVSPAERQQHLARMLGQSTSVQKAAAARKNGAKGGRPKKQVVVKSAKKTVRKVAASVRKPVTVRSKH
jgi:hypothetical protein